MFEKLKKIVSPNKEKHDRGKDGRKGSRSDKPKHESSKHGKRRDDRDEVIAGPSNVEGEQRNRQQEPGGPEAGQGDSRDTRHRRANESGRQRPHGYGNHPSRHHRRETPDVSDSVAESGPGNQQDIVSASDDRGDRRMVLRENSLPPLEEAKRRPRPESRHRSESQRPRAEGSASHRDCATSRVRESGQRPPQAAASGNHRRRHGEDRASGAARPQGQQANQNDPADNVQRAFQEFQLGEGPGWFYAEQHEDWDEQRGEMRYTSTSISANAEPRGPRMPNPPQQGAAQPQAGASRPAAREERARPRRQIWETSKVELVSRNEMIYVNDGDWQYSVDENELYLLQDPDVSNTHASWREVPSPRISIRDACQQLLEWDPKRHPGRDYQGAEDRLRVLHGSLALADRVLRLEPWLPKMFNDLDTHIFRGHLRHRVLIEWIDLSQCDDPNSFGYVQLPDDFEKGRVMIRLSINIPRSRDMFEGILAMLHVMLHAYFGVMCKTLSENVHDTDDSRHGPLFAEAWTMIVDKMRRLGRLEQLGRGLDIDASYYNEVRQSHVTRSCGNRTMGGNRQ